MIKLLLRAVHNTLYALEDLVYDMALNVDKLLSAVTLGAKGETVSARIWRWSLPESPAYARIPGKLLRLIVDGAARLLAGQAGHCQGAYNSFVAEQKPA